MELGKKLKHLRVTRDMTIKEVCAFRTMPSIPTWCCWEHSRTEPNATQIVRICHVFGITPNELLGWDETACHPGRYGGSDNV